ncbi:META domain-containing protein [Hyphomonadaceae bacterium BL14]|nr:META domain-containing protein [Hyphomonadaceae bacterium BL14]
MIRLAFALPVSAALLAACSAPDPAANTAAAPAGEAAQDTVLEAGAANALIGPEWTVTEIEGQAALAEAAPTIAFLPNGVTGSAGCNRFNGEYQADASALSFGALSTTRMACADERMQQERTFLTLLSQAVSYQASEDGTGLVLTAEDGRTITAVR